MFKTNNLYITDGKITHAEQKANGEKIFTVVRNNCIYRRKQTNGVVANQNETFVGYGANASITENGVYIFKEDIKFEKPLLD